MKRFNNYSVKNSREYTSSASPYDFQLETAKLEDIISKRLSRRPHLPQLVSFSKRRDSMDYYQKVVQPRFQRIMSMDIRKNFDGFQEMIDSYKKLKEKNDFFYAKLYNQAH